MNAKRLTTLSMLIALYCVLSSRLCTVELPGIKFTLEAFPVLVASLLLGPIAGLIVGGVGSFIYQVFFSGYGFMATTILWVLPHAISGMIVGLYAKAKNYNLSYIQTILIAIVSAVLVTALNTIVLYLDAKIVGYPYTFVLASTLTRIIIGIVLAIVFGLVLPKLIKRIKKL